MCGKTHAEGGGLTEAGSRQSKGRWDQESRQRFGFEMKRKHREKPKEVGKKES